MTKTKTVPLRAMGSEAGGCGGESTPIEWPPFVTLLAANAGGAVVDLLRRRPAFRRHHLGADAPALPEVSASARSSVSVAVTWKKALLVGLVVLLVVAGLPILLPGMSGGHCPLCVSDLAAGCTGVATFAVMALSVVLLAAFLRHRRQELPLLLRAVALYRPPRMV